jgi:hypothetical protein
MGGIVAESNAAADLSLDGFVAGPNHEMDRMTGL